MIPLTAVAVPNPNAIYDIIAGKTLYIPNKLPSAFDRAQTSAQAACQVQMPAPYFSGAYLITYSEPRAGVHPDYGQGCYYHVVYTLSDGTITDDYPNWFGQNWYTPTFVCPDGYSVDDIEMGPRGFGFEYGTSICTKVISLYVALDIKNSPKDLGNSCPAEGNPINPAIGNKFQIEANYEGGGLSSLRWALTYNSLARNSGHWTHNYSSKLKPAAPWPLPPPSTIQSSRHYSLTSVCGSGWMEIRSNAPTVELRSSFAVYENGGCSLYNNTWTTKLGILPIYSDTIPRHVKIYSEAIDLLRPDGKAYRFYKSGGTWITDAGIQGRLEGFTDNGGFPTGWRYTTADDTVELYDASGKLLSITTRAGLTQTLSYNTAHHLHQVTDELARALTFTYDAENRISTLTDPAGGVYRYTYGANNNLTAVTYPDNKTRTYLYEDTRFPNALTGILDENNERFATYTYDAQGRANSTEHAGGAQRATLIYNADGTTTVTDALGTVRTYNFQTISGVAKNTGVSQPCATCGGNAAQNLSYDANGNLASKTDFNGVVTTYTYDLSRNLETSRTEAYGTAQARTISTQWHPGFRLPTLISEPGKTTAYTYGSRGLAIQKTVTDTALNTSRTWTYAYNGLGLLTSADGPRSDVNDVTSYRYDAQGNLASITNALGQVTRITQYNAHGHPLTIIDPNGLTTTLAYSPRGWLTRRSVDGRVTSYTYDGVGQLIRITLPDGANIHYTYDAAHRLTGITDPLGHRIRYTMDAMGNRVREETLDPSGSVVRTHTRVFDALNRLHQVIGAQNQTTSYTYDNNGNRTGETDPLGRATTYAYDVLDRLTQITDAQGGLTAYGYDAADRPNRITAPNNAATRYGYDGLGNLTQETSPDRGVTTSTQDAAGNAVSVTDARGITAAYTYDALNRLLRVDYPGTAEDIAYTYDSAAGCTYGVGRLCQVVDASGTSVYAYDPFGHLVEERRTVQGLTYTTRYAYDTLGRVSALTYPDGRLISYTRDAAGRLSGVSATVNGAATTLVSGITRRADGHISAMARSNGLRETRDYDLDGRLLGQSVGNYARVYSYDAAGNVTLAQSTTQLATYTYDALDRLTQDYTASAQSFTYDANSNRLKKDSVSYVYNPTSNRLVKVGSTALTLDAAGNTVTQGAWSYRYNQAGQLAEVRSGTTLRGTYTYDAQGRRAYKKVGSVTTVYHYDLQGRLIAETKTTGALLRAYVYLDDLPIAQIDRTTLDSVLHLYGDHLDTPRLATDSMGKTVWRWEGRAFGETAPVTDPDGDRKHVSVNLRFAGQYYDAESGLFYNWNRYYDPKTGRYLSSDPIGLEGGLNTYAYVGSNPLYWIDPLGLAAAVPMPAPVTIPGFRLPTPNPWWMLIYPKPAGEGSDIVPQMNKDGSESKPNNCPSGTLPIDKAKGPFGLDKDDVHGIKKGIRAGPRTWTGIDPDGNVWTGGPGGVGENHGPFGGYLPGGR